MASADTTTFTWRIEQGEREQLTIPIYDENNSLAFITGWTIDAQIKDRPGGDTLYVFPDELAQVFGGGAFIGLTVPAPVSAAWLWRTGWFRVVITEPDTGPVDPTSYRVLEGPVVIDAS